MMKCIAFYPSYEEANERQLDLFAAEIDARVEYIPTGMDQVYFGRLPVYALLVPPEHTIDAVDLLRLVADESHRCLYRCVKCDSNDVIERPLDEGFGAGVISFPLTLGLIGIARMLAMRLRGRKYQCRACGTVYRLKP